MDFRLAHPPRWDANAHPRPLVVYLDQWCWNELVWDRADQPQSSGVAGLYTYLRDLALAGRVVFPLSQAHYQETGARTNADGRWDTAVVMAELSGFNTITPVGLDLWEAEVAVAGYCGLGVDVPTPNPFGWGHHHCLRGVQVRGVYLGDATGARLNLGSLTPEQVADIRKVEEECTYRFELAMLARRDPRLEAAVGMAPFEPWPNENGPKFADAQRKLAVYLEQYGKTTRRVREWLHGLSLSDSTPLIMQASTRLGLDPRAVLDDLTLRVEAGDLDSLTDFLARMPIQHTFTELRVQAHLKDNFGFKPSDLFDLFSLATVLPFVDLAIADRKTVNLFHDAGVDGSVLHRLADLRATLEARLR